MFDLWVNFTILFGVLRCFNLKVILFYSNEICTLWLVHYFLTKCVQINVKDSFKSYMSD